MGKLGLQLGLQRFRKGAQLNYYQVTDAWNANSVNSISEIFYQLNGTDYQVDAFVPIKGGKYVKYPIIVDRFGFMSFN